jgi:hypothetical protein
MISQASRGIVNFMSNDSFLVDNIIIDEVEIEVSDEVYCKIVELCEKKAGIPYSKKQIIGILIAQLLRLDRNPFDMSKQTVVCSEWVGLVLVLAGYKFETHLSLLTPVHIWKACHENKN